MQVGVWGVMGREWIKELGKKSGWRSYKERQSVKELLGEIGVMRRMRMWFMRRENERGN